MANKGLDIRLLGQPLVTLDGEPIEVDTRKAIGLLAYLAVEKTGSRELLASLFWAESSPDRARATLRRTLSTLRNAVGSDVVAADRNRVELSPTTVCDVDEFLEHIEATKTHEHEAADVCSRCIPHLTRADGLYRGDFLEAFSTRGAPDFEDWSRSVAESMRLKEGEVLNRLAVALATEGDYHTAIETVGRWIGLDGLHEPAHRLMMLVNAWAGDRPRAIQAYRDCVAILDRELGVPPLDETTELYEAILDEDLPPAPGPRSELRSHPRGTAETSGEMLDRGAAIVTLEDALASVESKGQLVMITGESWMGKTRLIEKLVEVARERDILVIQARAYRTEQTLPYGVATQLLGAVSPAVDEISEDLPGWMLLELARLDPRLSPIKTEPLTGRFGQLRFLEAIHELFLKVAVVRPLVVTIDDAQWVDSASATLLAYVAKRLTDARILIVASARTGESLAPALEEAAAEAEQQVVLEPLRRSDLIGLAEESDIDAAIDATGGIPLLVHEALKSDAQLGESSSVLRYMESHLREISDLARQVLTAAAVLSGMCEPMLLRETSGRTEDEVVEAVEQLISRHVLEDQGDGNLAFTLDALEAHVYEQTSPIRRNLLHRRAAEALQERPRAKTEARLATGIASQLKAAGSQEAAGWYRLAGDLARRVYANVEAEQLYEDAIALGVRDVGDVRLALGELAMARGDYERAMRELFAAASHLDGSSLALAEHRIGDLHRLLGRFDLADASFTRARRDHPNPAELFADWALLRHRTGRYDEAITFAEQARVESQNSGDHSAFARSLNILGMVTPDRSAAMTYLDEALALTTEDDPARMAALNNKAHLLGEDGETEAARVLVSDAIAISEKLGLRHHRAALYNHLADLNQQAGFRDEAERSLTHAVTIFADIDAGEWEPEIWLLRQW